MNKQNIIILLVSIMAVMWLSFAIFNYSVDEVNPVIKELKQLKKTFDSCDSNEWCCKETWVDGKLKEKECRQFE